MSTHSPRGSSRDAIRAAAERLFTERGYAATTVRDIAAEAEVDPALVIRHFTGKESLFLQTMQLALEPAALLEGPLEHLGEAFIRFLLESGEQTRGVYLALLRASDTEGVSTRLRDVHVTAFVTPLRARLEGPDAELRAAMCASIVGGLFYSLWVVGDETLLAAPTDVLARRYGALLQRLITP